MNPNAISRPSLISTLVAVLLGTFTALQPSTLRAAPATATALVTVRVLGHADAEVAQGAVTVSKLSDLDFGTIPAGPRARRAVVAPESRSATTYRVGGGYNATFAVSLPDSAVVKNGSSAITVKSFMTAGAESGHLSEQGTATVGVGASLEVSPNQVPGVYTGSFPLTVAYN